MSRKKILKLLKRRKIRGGAKEDASIDFQKKVMKSMYLFVDRATMYFYDEVLNIEEWRDIEAQAEALCGADIPLRMPTNFSYFEIIAMQPLAERGNGASPITVQVDSPRIHAVVIDITRKDYDAIDTSVYGDEIFEKITAYFIISMKIEGFQTYSLCPFMFMLNRETGGVTYRKMYDYDASDQGIEKADDSFRAAVEIAAIHIIGIIVLSKTKGFPMVTQRGDPIQLIPRRNPKNARVHIKIGQARYDSTNAINAEGGPRRKMRLHMRRGHYRRQHWGHKNRQVKTVWIDSVMVGYVEEGKISHDYEIVTHQ